MSHNARRYRNRQIRDLTEKERSLREQLIASEARVVEATNRTDVIVAGAHKQIEEYVDHLAKVANADDKRTAFPFEEDERVFRMLVDWQWHGVATLEQAKEELAQEVAHRSVGKTDLALLLSSVDRTAFLLYGQMPDVFKNLHGEELVAEIVKSLMDEEFIKTLMEDTRWAEMRRRWVRFGWRGTNEETFNAVFIRAAAERVVEIHDEHTVRDTILDERIQRENPTTRDQMIENFRVRLEREYDALPRRTPAADKLVEMDVTFTHDEIKRLDRIADRWDTSRNGAMDRIVREAVQNHVSQPGVVVSSQSRDDADFVNEGDWWNDAIPYSDHELMRRGRVLWEGSYAQGMIDEEVRKNVVRSDAGFPAELVHFSAKWAVHAFQRLMTSHTFAAALMCSDVQRDVLVGIEKQWDAFLVIVPNGMLIADRFEFTRVMIAVYDFGARMLLVTADPLSKHRRSPVGLVDEAPTLADLLVSEEADLSAESPAARCFVMAKRLVAGLLLNLQDAGTHKVRKVDARPKSKGREAEPEHRIVTVGAPIEIDCRGAVKEYIEHGTRNSEKGHRRHGTPTVQWMVRGHYRMQAHGPKHTLRRKTWIRPHWQGHEAALIQTRAKVTS